MSRRLTTFTAAAIATGLGATGMAGAQPTSSAEFLSAYEGNWRGSGESRPNLRSEPTRITCRISASFDEQAAALTNEGRCGTTQGSRNLRGTMQADGQRLRGDFLGQATAAGLMNPRAKIDQNMIVSEAEVEQGSSVVRVRTFLTHPVDGAFRVQSQFFDRSANEWVISGEINFTRAD